MQSPLRSPRLRRIIAAYTVNRLGTWFGVVALSLAVFDHTHNALAVAALLFAWQALPAFAVPAVVARVEASPRRNELSALYLFEAVVTAGLAALVLWHFSLPDVLLLAALDGTAALAASALLRAELARVARESAGASRDDSGREVGISAEAAEEAERKANAALNVAFSATFVLGPVLGGVVVATAGASAALIVDVVSFLACAWLLMGLHPHVEQAAGDSVGARLRAAWRHINEAPSLRGLLLVELCAFVFFESAAPIEVSYAKATLHAGDRGFGLLLSTWGAGAVIGSVVFARSLQRPLGVLLSAGTLAVGLAYVGFAAAPSLALACCAAFVGGVGNGMRASLPVQHCPEPHAAAAARPPDGRSRIAERRVGRDRPAARRRPRGAEFPAHRIPSGGTGRRCQRRSAAAPFPRHCPRERGRRGASGRDGAPHRSSCNSRRRPT